ncbi:unnamed protein product [Cylicostephanus goldi]|uniref:Ubiquitin-like protease family profile domain-containing protein n=1 Tax=Cylicostephanus goldi TaxID=71465 RepID=A0A3P6QDU0_CYLGO|nr:unnamed protein product [Cylicostephanus goldi]
MDPLLVQTNEAFRIREYPVRDGKCFVALHLLGGTHWALGVFDFPMRIAHVYDSLAYKYNYSSNYFENNEPAARSLWKKITDIPLEQIVIAGNEHVHSQVDHSSCGVFTCLYADRLANNIATKSEVATRSFLRSVRNLIDSRLRSCYVVDEADASGSVPLPRIYEQTLEKQCTLSFVENVSDEHLNNVDASEISVPGKLTKIDIQSKNSEIIIPPSRPTICVLPQSKN